MAAFINHKNKRTIVILVRFALRTGTHYELLTVRRGRPFNNKFGRGVQVADDGLTVDDFNILFSFLKEQSSFVFLN